MAGSWWRVPAGEEVVGDPAYRLWRNACGTLMAPSSEEAWKQIQESSAPNKPWHSLSHCVAHQAQVWMDLLQTGIMDVIQPAAFKLAIVLRHTPPEIVVTLLTDMLKMHPQSQDLTAYILSLLTDDEPQCTTCLGSEDSTDEDSGNSSGSASNDDFNLANFELPGSAPIRDLQLFGDCELSVLAATPEQYKEHVAKMRKEYGLPPEDFVKVRMDVLRQFTSIANIFHTPEFGSFEPKARQNLDNEIKDLLKESIAISAAKKKI